jgi:hypothetical protein
MDDTLNEVSLLEGKSGKYHAGDTEPTVGVGIRNNIHSS